MKIEQLIVQHLYNNKKVTLQDIGSFILSSNVSMPAESDKDGIMPDNAISFEYDTKAVQDESLIQFIIQQTRKIKPLATSDLESYTILGREYLNIGKPFPIEGLGTLLKSQNGQYEFIQGNSVNARLQAAPALIKEKDEEEIIFSTPVRKQNNNKAGMLLIALIFLLAVAAALIYFLNKKDNTTAVAVNADTSVIKKDTVSQPLITPAPSPLIDADSSTFKLVIKEYSSKEEADKALIKLTSFGHKLILDQSDSTVYRLTMPFTSPLSDTLKIKDSINRIFGGKTTITL
ncbi:MAG: hypothetical protein WKF35_03955 [Ferruginibacter sp.]